MNVGEMGRALRDTALLLLLVLGVAAPVEARWEDIESAQLGVAPPSFQGLQFAGGTASIHEDGARSANFIYRSPGRQNRISGSLLLNWVERAAPGKRQRSLPPKISFGGEFDGTFSLTHQVNARFDVSATPGYPDFLPLAQLIVQRLEARALPRARSMAAFRPPPKTGRYYLRYSIEFSFDERTGDRYAEFI